MRAPASLSVLGRSRAAEAGRSCRAELRFCGHCANCLRGEHSYCDEMWAANFGGLARRWSSALFIRTARRLLARFFNQSSFSQFAIAGRLGRARDQGCADRASRPARLRLPSRAPVPSQRAESSAWGLDCGVRRGQCWPLARSWRRRLAGASHIVAIDKVGSRLDVARELGAHRRR